MTRKPAHTNKTPGQAEPTYILRLYITGATPHSMLAVKNLKFICDTYLQGKYSLEIFDVYQQAALALEENIIAAPTLIIIKPEPCCKLIGDLSDTAKVLSKLGIIEGSHEKSSGPA